MSDLKGVIGTRQYNILEKKGYTTFEQITRIFPRRYYDLRETVPLSTNNDNQMRAYYCRFVSVEMSNRSGKSVVKVKVEEQRTGRFLFISWFNTTYLYRKLVRDYYKGMPILVCGKATYLPQYHNFFMQNPFLFNAYSPNLLRIYTVYPHFGGMADDTMQEIIGTAMMRSTERDFTPESLLMEYGLPKLENAVYELHHPVSRENIWKARRRMQLDDMLYLSLKIEVENRRMNCQTPYKVISHNTMDQIIRGLKYNLTKDQNRILHSILDDMKKGRRVNDLIQGDVGCGKTIVAFLLMAASAENGYQSLLFVPTTVLAEQHYKELKELMEPYGKKVFYLESGMKAAERRKTLQAIESGDADMVVGTHSVLSQSVQFRNLGLAIIDEEHKFGVIQRQSISEKADEGVHTITMSATPIPRTLSEAIFTENKKIYNIISMPAGRKAVTTYISNNENKDDALILDEIRKGRQVYVVCPLIYEEEKDTKLRTVEDTYQVYKSKFGEDKVGLLHGKLKQDEAKEVIGKFMSGEYKILVSTTVIEVGVNNPNASVMLIHNAERFGLAGLHQLRGRIGRGEYAGYCILSTEEVENERLNVMCKSTNGFDIAEADLQIRGMGNPIGLEQSGFNKLVETAMSFRSVFAKTREEAKRMVDAGLEKPFIENYEKSHGNG